MYKLQSLPNEILINIFEYCKVLPLTMVCKQFNEIISNTPSLMRKFHLLITERSKCLEIANSKRKHQNVLIKFNYKIDSSILEILKKFGDQIKTLELMRCILTEDLFIDMMELLNNLKTLSIYTTYLRSNFQFQDMTPKPLKCMENLKKLNFRNSDPKFLDILKNSREIKFINISLPHQHPATVINQFLKDHCDAEVIENIMAAEIDESITLYILCDMKHMKKLSLEIDKISLDDIRNLTIKNTSIEYLNLYGTPPDPVDFNSIMNFFKNLKALEIEINNVLEPINMLQIQRTASKIESLKIMNCYGDFFNHISLPNLKTFEVNDITSFTAADWINFSQRNPKVENLIVKDEAMTNEIFTVITQEFRHLKYLETFYDPQRLTHEILNYICDFLFPRNIRTLKIRKRQWERYPSSYFTLSNDHKDKLNTNIGFNLILR